MCSIPYDKKRRWLPSALFLCTTFIACLPAGYEARSLTQPSRKGGPKNKSLPTGGDLEGASLNDAFI